MKWDLSFEGAVQKFPGDSGWIYVEVPKTHRTYLKQKRRDWGRYPITARVGSNIWQTKLMVKKGGDFFVALKATIRNKENISVGDNISVSIKLR